MIILIITLVAMFPTVMIRIALIDTAIYMAQSNRKKESPDSRVKNVWNITLLVDSESWVGLLNKKCWLWHFYAWRRNVDVRTDWLRTSLACKVKWMNMKLEQNKESDKVSLNINRRIVGVSILINRKSYQVHKVFLFLFF